MSLRCLGIDGGTNPGYCSRNGNAFQVAPDLQGLEAVGWDVAAVEGQFQTEDGFVSRGGKKTKIRRDTAINLAFCAGGQLMAVNAKRKLKLPCDIWRGLLWSDGANMLAKAAVLERLRDWQPLLRTASDDEVEAFGIAYAAELIGFAKKGQLRNGQPWVAKPKKFWEDIQLVSVRGKARAFAKGLKLAT